MNANTAKLADNHPIEQPAPQVKSTSEAWLRTMGDVDADAERYLVEAEKSTLVHSNQEQPRKKYSVLYTERYDILRDRYDRQVVVSTGTVLHAPIDVHRSTVENVDSLDDLTIPYLTHEEVTSLKALVDMPDQRDIFSHLKPR